MSEFLSTLVGAAVVLLGIWLKARIDRGMERQSVAAVAYAEIAEWMRQLRVGAEIFRSLSKTIERDKLREIGEQGTTLQPDPKKERQLRLAQRQFRIMQEYAKEFGARSLLHTSPEAIGRLGPHFAYVVRTMYARIEALGLRIVVSIAAATEDIDGVLNLLNELDLYDKEIQMLNQLWEQAGPALLRAAGGQVQALARRQASG